MKSQWSGSEKSITNVQTNTTRQYQQQHMTEQVKTEHYCQIEYDASGHLLYIKFIGDMKESEYKDIWRSGVQKAFELGIEKFIIDQSEIGSVPFLARAWVITSLYGKIKRELSPDLAVSVLSSSDKSHKSGMQYLVKGFRKLSGFEIDFHPTYQDAASWLNSIHS